MALHVLPEPELPYLVWLPSGPALQHFAKTGRPSLKPFLGFGAFSAGPGTPLPSDHGAQCTPCVAPSVITSRPAAELLGPLCPESKWQRGRVFAEAGGPLTRKEWFPLPGGAGAAGGGGWGAAAAGRGLPPRARPMRPLQPRQQP